MALYKDGWVALLRMVSDDPRVLEKDPSRRGLPFLALGVADIGRTVWCEAQAAASQRDTEVGYCDRGLKILSERSEAPAFLAPRAEVMALEIAPPSEREVSPGAPAWERVEAEVTRDCWHVAMAAAFPLRDRRIRPSVDLLLVGVTDGVLDSGTVVEVRQSHWEQASIRRRRVTDEKAIQANVYAVLLGAKAWRCVFDCSDGRFSVEGTPDTAQALAAIRRAARQRLGLRPVRGVADQDAWKCKDGRCRYVDVCAVTPLRRTEA